MGTRIDIRLFSLVGIVCVLILASTLPPLAQAAPSTLPPRPTSVFPPRPTSQPTATPTPPPPSAALPRGAYIALHVRPPQIGMWTVVQWQDSWGDWHDVQGWEGVLETGSQKAWWVAQGDLGTGPFRWNLYQDQNADLLASSEPFYLPDNPGDTTRVEIRLTSFPADDSESPVQPNSSESAHDRTNHSEPKMIRQD
jgi:hypothetical protein